MDLKLELQDQNIKKFAITGEEISDNYCIHYSELPGIIFY
jgi:hypothetical protein